MQEPPCLPLGPGASRAPKGQGRADRQARAGSSEACPRTGSAVRPLPPPVTRLLPTFAPPPHSLPPAIAAFPPVSWQTRVLHPPVRPEHSLPHPHAPRGWAFPDCPAESLSWTPPISCLPSPLIFLQHLVILMSYLIYLTIFIILPSDEVHREVVLCKELLLAQTQDILVE